VLRVVDTTLRTLFKARMTLLGAPGPVTDDQVGITPPDTAWEASLNDISPLRALNVYLAEIRENRELRSVERTRTAQAGMIVPEPAPMRVDCHYLISAWSPSGDRRTKTLDEHEVLAEALEVLVDEQAIVVGGLELPTEIVPPGGFPKLAEFWGTMGTQHRWRPVIQLIVTIPVRHRLDVTGPPVTTRVIEYRQGAAAASAERFIQIAGRVLDTAGVGVSGAWVRLEDLAGEGLQATRSRADGEFDLLRVDPGTYRLRARSPQHAEGLTPPLTVPAPAGAHYDVVLP
jgi:uncharacterized protein DUF4255/carboxypeptidase family protein